MGYRLNTPIKLSRLADELSYRWKGSDIIINSVSSFHSAGSCDLTFSSAWMGAKPGTAIVSKLPGEACEMGGTGVLESEQPRLTFIEVLDYLCKKIGFSTWNLPAVIDSTARIGQNVVIEPGCVVGANSVIEHNVVLHAGTRIGSCSRVRACSSIGGDGFGFERSIGGKPIRFPHLGGVVIGSNVEIGSCVAIARGTLSDTIIEDNVKIDNLVHIAHNCLIRNGAFVIACAEISGGVEVGRNAWIAPNSCTHQKITIGDESIVGLGAVVIKDIPSRTVYAGNPAKKIKDV